MALFRAEKKQRIENGLTSGGRAPGAGEPRTARKRLHVLLFAAAAAADRRAPTPIDQQVPAVEAGDDAGSGSETAAITCSLGRACNANGTIVS